MIPQHLAGDAHDVIVPSLSAFAFSSTITGILGLRRISELMTKLMKLLF
jgi:microsomal epoxide hydrolase